MSWVSGSLPARGFPVLNERQANNPAPAFRLDALMSLLRLAFVALPVPGAEGGAWKAIGGQWNGRQHRGTA